MPSPGGGLPPGRRGHAVKCILNPAQAQRPPQHVCTALRVRNNAPTPESRTAASVCLRGTHASRPSSGAGSSLVTCPRSSPVLIFLPVCGPFTLLGRALHPARLLLRVALDGRRGEEAHLLHQLHIFRRWAHSHPPIHLDVTDVTTGRGERSGMPAGGIARRQAAGAEVRQAQALSAGRRDGGKARGRRKLAASCLLRLPPRSPQALFAHDMTRA